MAVSAGVKGAVSVAGVLAAGAPPVQAAARAWRLPCGAHGDAACPLVDKAQCRRTDTPMPGVRTDSGTRPPESGAHLGSRLGVVSRIGTRCGQSAPHTPKWLRPGGSPHVDERYRGSPVGPRLPRACRKTRACDGAYQQLRGRHRARVRRAQGPSGAAVCRVQRGDGDDGRDRRARRPRSQGVWARRRRRPTMPCSSPRRRCRPSAASMW